MSTELDQRVAKLEEFAADVRGFTKLLTEIVRRQDERFDELRDEQSNADVRIAALADAQIKTEDALQRLTSTIERHVADGHGG